LLAIADDGIVVVRGRAGKGEFPMDLGHVPDVLHARLGDEATSGLLQLFDRSHREARKDLISACTERFERRLVEEASGLRVQIARDMAQLEGSLRQEMAQLRASLREDIAAGRVDLFKWCFLFWIGQVLAVSGIVGVMFRVMR
jgi:hypothetical protein